MDIPFHTVDGPIDLSHLRPIDLSAEVVGEAMAKINRFGGRTPEPWSVAAHSVLVEALCPPDLQPWALLHDVHKVFLGDLMDPSVELLCRSGTRSAVEHAIQNAENRIDLKIGTTWGVAPRSMSQALRTACQVAFLAEVWTFLGTPPGPLSGPEAQLLDKALAALTDLDPRDGWRVARNRWLERVETHARAGHLSPPR